MKRLLAITVLALGLLPSLPVFTATALSLAEESLNDHCRSRLGIGQTEPVYGLVLQQIKRCMTNTAEQFKIAETLQRRAGIGHYVQRYDEAQAARPVFRETQRSLTTRMLKQEEIRIDYYKTSTVSERAEALNLHRISRRLAVREKEQQLFQERLQKQMQWQRAIQACRYSVRSQSGNCALMELTR